MAQIKRHHGVYAECEGKKCCGNRKIQKVGISGGSIANVEKAMKTVLITGVSRGIGRALAEIFLANEYFVVGTSTKGIADIKHDNLVVFQLDLANSSSIEKCTQEI